MTLRTITLFVALAVSLPSFATVVLGLNTEFFWDSKLPHDGQIAMGAVGNPPSEKYVQLEANAIALHIIYNDADIVGLTEI